MADKLQNLKALKGGLYKRWVLINEKDYQRVCDYLQKINFSIDDFNYEIKHIENSQIKEFVFLIMLTVWIQEAAKSLECCYRKDVLEDFAFAKEDELNKASKYINALRSFVVAHPLSTNRHEKYGFDGDLICVDIRTNGRYLSLQKDEMFFHLNLEGISKERCENDDYFLYVYSKKEDDMQFFRYIGCCLDDVVLVANLYIEKIYALDSYISRQKKRNFETRVKNEQT